jgi:phage gpG-like protein
MFISAKAFFEDNSANNKVLIKQAETAIPAAWVKLFKKNVVDLTPKKTGALRRSIITQSMGTRAQIGWRSAYAGAQEQGYHTSRSGKKAVYQLPNYTTPGTGPHFARDAFRATSRQMPAVLRELGLTK